MGTRGEKKGKNLKVSFSPRVRMRWFFKRTEDIDPGTIVRGKGHLKDCTKEVQILLRDEAQRKLSKVGHKPKGGVDLESIDFFDTRPIPLLRVWETNIMSGEEECKGCSKTWTFDDETLEDIQRQELEESAYQPMIYSIVKHRQD